MSVPFLTMTAVPCMPVFWKCESAQIICDREVRQIEIPVPQKHRDMEDEGYQYEIRHVQDCLRKHLTESALVTHDMTRNVLRSCDEIRRQWNLVYPFETSGS